MCEWTTGEVCDWMKDSGFGGCTPHFIENRIEGCHLHDLTKDDLDEMGLKAIGTRKNFQGKVKEMANSQKSDK